MTDVQGQVQEAPQEGNNEAGSKRKNMSSTPEAKDDDGKAQRILSPEEKIKLNKSTRFSGESLERLLKVKRVKIEPIQVVHDNATSQPETDFPGEGGTPDEMQKRLVEAMTSKNVRTMFNEMLTKVNRDREIQVDEIIKQTDAHADCLGTLHDRLHDLEQEVAKMTLANERSNTRIEEL